MPDQHPDLFFSVSETKFNRAVASIDREIPYLTDYQIVLEFAELVASVSTDGQDGHTHLHLLGGTLPLPQSLYPLRLYWFSDGLFVTHAMEPHEDLVGARVVSIDDVPVDEIYSILEPAVARDNEIGVLATVPYLYVFSEILQAAGVTGEGDEAEWEFEGPGPGSFAVRLSPVAGEVFWPWNRTTGLPIPARSPEPLHLSNREENFWLRFLDEQNTLYIQYNAAEATTQSGETLADFASRIQQFVSDQEVDRVVVDLRLNSGGDNTTYDPLLEVLASNAINQSGRLFAIIGRHTFSAGINFATELEQNTDAIFVGEPTGGSPNQYGDADPIILPNSGIIVGVSTRYHEKSDADDPRLQIDPDIPAEVSSLDFFAGRDPALEATLVFE